jgi:hypothetical protein
MVNTMVGDLFDMEDTSIALSCSNIATSLTAGSAFIIGMSTYQCSTSRLVNNLLRNELFGCEKCFYVPGPNASLRTKSLLFSTLGALSLLSVATIAPRVKAARKAKPT